MEWFIQLHRQMLEWEWYKNWNVFNVFIHCLLKANWSDKKWEWILIKRWEFITSYQTLANELSWKNNKFTVMQVRTALKKLNVTGEITIKTTNKFTIVKVNNYNTYQVNNTVDNNQITNKQQSNNNQITTTNNINKNNKENKYKGGDLVNVKTELTKFIEHRNNLYKEKRQVTKKLLEAYKKIRKEYTKEQFVLAYTWYNKKKEWVEDKTKHLEPLTFLIQSNWFIKYL